MPRLEPDTIDHHMTEFPEWSHIGEGDAMQRTFGFKDFREAMAFVTRVADVAESQKHHPDILIRFNKVTLTLSTHSAGGLTEQDLALARAIDQLKGAGSRPRKVAAGS